LSYFLHYGIDPIGKYICHKCDNPKCVNPHHLFLGTAQDNNRDKSAKGRALKGEKHGMAKLTTKIVREIREALASGRSQSAIARLYGIDKSTVSNINRGKYWNG